jgi:2-oxoglutarate dehydrogenase E2 component (dihydrolipoamide succinyltransferase)
MAIPLKVPSLGESVTQASVGTWLKNEGDVVQADEPLVEVESEKATVALPAPAAGVLRKVLRNTGDTVAVGEIIGELEERGSASPPSPPEVSASPPSPPAASASPPSPAAAAASPPSPPARAGGEGRGEG